MHVLAHTCMHVPSRPQVCGADTGTSFSCFQLPLLDKPIFSLSITHSQLWSACYVQDLRGWAERSRGTWPLRDRNHRGVAPGPALPHALALKPGATASTSFQQTLRFRDQKAPMETGGQDWKLCAQFPISGAGWYRGSGLPETPPSKGNLDWEGPPRIFPITWLLLPTGGEHTFLGRYFPECPVGGRHNC